jgi:hypothetical protein
VDETGAGHRLDDGRDGLAVDLLDPAGEGSRRADVGRDGELVQVRSLIGEQTDVDFLSTESSVQHVKRALLGARRLVITTERVTNGGPSSRQSKAGSGDPMAGAHLAPANG